MAFTSFTISKHRKEKNRWKIETTTVTHDRMGKWEGSGSYADLYLVSDVFVMMNPFNQKPLAVFSSIENCAKELQTQFGCKVEVI